MIEDGDPEGVDLTKAVAAGAARPGPDQPDHPEPTDLDAADLDAADLDAALGDEIVDPQTARLVTALEQMRSRLADLSLPLVVPGVDAARKDRATLLDQLDDYLLPRLRQLDAPLLAVVGGSTGAGKSTLVNSVLRRAVTRAGVLRPTTRSPVLVHNPADERWFTGSRILPSLARLTGADPEPDAGQEALRITAVRLVCCDALPPGMALLDAPDIDSVVHANRELAAQLLAAADLWLFVTTAARYADAVPWNLLTTAADRGASVAVVLNRVPPDAMGDVRADLATMLTRNGLSQSPLFAVAEVPLQDGLLPSRDVAVLRLWLADLSDSAAARQEVVRRTLSGALDSLDTRVPQLADAADGQTEAAAVLRAELETAYAEADGYLQRGLTDGSLLRGEVLARWQEFVGTGEVLRGLQSGVGRIRDRVVAAITGKPAPSEPLGHALQSGVAALVHAQAGQAAEEAVLRWRAHPAGAALVAAAGDQIARLSPDFDDRLERMVRDWQGFVLDLVRDQGSSKRSQARAMSLGVNALGITLMLLVFASTAAIPTGAEVGVGAGTAVVGQGLLEAVFGDQAVRTLAAQARTDLLARVDALLDTEKDRLLGLLHTAGVDDEAATRLRETAQDVRAAR